MEGSGGVTTLLFTDIEGSTRLWEREAANMSPALAQHDLLSRLAVERNGGYVVKMTGDGMYAAFDDAIDALNASLMLQQSLNDPAATNGITFRVRYGLHLGAVERRNDDLFGSPVNRAARVMKAAHGGQILLSQAVVDDVASRLPPDVTLLDRGRAPARPRDGGAHLPACPPATAAGLSGAALARGDAEQSATAGHVVHRPGAGAHRHQGAARRYAAADPACMGGLGKTRLSLQIAADVLEKYPDGVWFVELLRSRIHRWSRMRSPRCWACTKSRASRWCRRCASTSRITSFCS